MPSPTPVKIKVPLHLTEPLAPLVQLKNYTLFRISEGISSGPEKITDEDSYVKATKKAHQQMQAVSKKIKAAEREVALPRKEFEEKPPADISADDKAKYESPAKYFRGFIDADGKRAFRDVERLMVDFHRELRNSMGLL